MPETTLTTDPDSPPEFAPTPRDLQRNALRDLLFLSRECVRLEAELELHHRESADESKVKFERQTRDFDYRLEALRRQVDEKMAERRQLILQMFDQGLKKANSEHSAKRSKFSIDFENVRAELKKRFDHASWLADSVLEAAELKAGQEYRKDCERHADLMDEINKREAEIVGLVQTYGVEPVPADQASINPEEILATADSVLAEQRQNVEQLQSRLRKMRFARLFVGLWPALIVVLVVAGAGAIVQYRHQTLEPQWNAMPYPVGGAFIGSIIVCVVLKMLSVTQVKKTYAPLRTALADTRVASTVVNENAKRDRVAAIAAATAHRNSEIERAKLQIAPVQQKAQNTRDAGHKAAEDERQAAMRRLQAAREMADAEAAQWKEHQLSEAGGKVAAEQERLRVQYGSTTAALAASYASRRQELQQRWRNGIQSIQAPIGHNQSVNAIRTDWRALDRTWQPAKTFPPTISFGSMQIDMARLSEGIPRDGSFDLTLPDQFAVPALLAFPSQASVLIQTDPDGREEGLRALQMIMTKLIVSLPPGRGRFTIIDPVGLGQSFAGFMHLADHDDQLVNGRIWTTSEQIDQRLTDLTEHMETVIQKYLRNEYETIDDYNAQAGELAEPYRFLVIADFPNGFEGDAWRRLVSIARTGARCGVYVLMLRDIRQPLPPEMMIEDIESVSANILRQDGRFVWQDETFAQFPLTLDTPPDEETLTRIVNQAGRAAKEANRVEVDFDGIAPREDQFWTLSAADEIAVPVGRSGATRLQYFRCGRGVAQHTLVAGKTGSGKSTLLHAMVTNLAMWYSPDEIEFYLIDFKKGVEFKTYADYQLPHARAIAVESDREFGLSVLQRIDAELTRRGELFRKAGVQDLGAYRTTSDPQVLPRVMLIIDEFQEIFTEDDKLAQEAQLLMDRLVRQGRAFGIHVFLGSQTIGGSGSLARSTIGQMAIRVALQCSETDSQLILGDNNSAARLLSRPGEAIYNDAGGAVENNSPFQVAWLPDPKREKYLARVQEKLARDGTKRKVIPPIVFEGNAPADISLNHLLATAIDTRNPSPISAPRAWVGEPVAIKEPTSLLFRRQSGANALIIGQQDEQAMSTLVAIAISLAAQLPGERASFVVLDGTPADSFLAGKMPGVLSALPNPIKNVDYRRVDEAVNELAEELARRQADEHSNHAAVFVIINGLQRYRTLRKGEEEFSFSVSDEPKKASAAKQLVDLIREGPNLGIHVIAWVDTLASIERTFERGLMREFDHRVLFQMSANDSSNLIDSPVANRLGFFRALAYSEEQGVMEKFRPYGLPPAAWLTELSQKLGK
ncbi:MAG: AAA family ATPase [Burkholderiales bacterium]|nr:AAA family ATPase [Phycisphaerae bacterium]